MPRIDDVLLDCVLYLYPSRVAAESGEHFGGSRFFVAVNSRVQEWTWYVYAVTNAHVVREGATTIRLNTKDGKIDILETNARDWFYHPDGDDLVICPVGEASGLSAARHKLAFTSREHLVTKDTIDQYKIGPGDEVFCVGRFINHEGKQQNRPAVRFGNISVMPWEPMAHPSGIFQESFMVEFRSLPGYSGSPVFVHIPPLSMRPGSNALGARWLGPWLLGIDWSHTNWREPVCEKGTDVPGQEGWWVNTNSGMAGVIPAWKLDEMLDLDPLKGGRDRHEQQLAKEKATASITKDGTTHATPPASESDRHSP